MDKISSIKKSTKRLLIAALVIIILSVISLPAYIVFKNSTFKRTDSKEKFLSGDYTSYNGGKEASEFFKRFAGLDNYEDISFKYRDNDNRITLKHDSHTVFVLDIKYNSEDYLSLKSSLFENTDKPDEENKTNYFGSYLLAAVNLQDKVFSDNYCGIFFDGEENTIRYVFIYNVERDNVSNSDLKAIMRSSVELEWN